MHGGQGRAGPRPRWAPVCLIALAVGVSTSARAAEETTDAEARAAVDRAAESVTAGEPAAAVEALREAMLAVWTAAPFALTRIEPSTEAATGFRAYTPREAAPYPAGTPLHLYIEPIGLDYTLEDGRYAMGLKADFLLLDTKGTILGGQRDFADVPFRSRVPSTDVFMTMSLGTESLPPNDYVLQVTVRDGLGDDSVTEEVAFTVVAP
ncbi:hypothetical protein [Roseospira navarrensis]|uniref:Uncharacterized protein n=1 Tax=Roseospira navarrensis TaxID=140058 RepID=A0A7X1ZFA8_9PROT|nr:hypothetical protein [Roseospira navarrensis]MQX36964.1 hypothetical protein [Roseospira navarrensis]